MILGDGRASAEAWRGREAKATHRGGGGSVGGGERPLGRREATEGADVLQGLEGPQ